MLVRSPLFCANTLEFQIFQQSIAASERDSYSVARSIALDNPHKPIDGHTTPQQRSQLLCKLHGPSRRTKSYQCQTCPCFQSTCERDRPWSARHFLQDYLQGWRFPCTTYRTRHGLYGRRTVDAPCRIQRVLVCRGRRGCDRDLGSCYSFSKQSSSDSSK